MDSYILFFSNNYAIWASKQLKKLGLEHKIIPVPRNMSSDCGYCIRIKSTVVDQVKGILDEMAIEYDRFE